MSVAREPAFDPDPDDAARLGSFPSERDAAERCADATATGSVRTEAVWHGGGTRDAYEALLVLLFAPEREPVQGACE